MPKKLKVAITGGIGSGKSSVCEILHSQNYPIIYADLISKEILSSDNSIKEKIISEFGKDAYSENKPNVKFLSEKVFADPKKVEKINSILHPPTIDKIQKTMNAELKKSDIVFTEAALIYEADMEELFDFVVVVAALDEIRIKRVMESRKLSREAVIERMQRQIPQEKKRKLADFVIENNGSKEELEIKTNFILTLLKSIK